MKLEQATLNTINVQKTARYISLGSLSKKTEVIWIALHGYGQLADYTASKFQFLDHEKHFVICPEGLNKFYWHKNNEPVACWMTKDNRYAEIDNFCNYLDALYNRYCNHVNREVKIVLFGFSQGCATVWRWLHARKPHFDMFINWAGWVPEDISYRHLEAYFSNKKLLMVYGDQDEFITEEVVGKLKGLLSENQLKMEEFQFEGKHHIPKGLLERVVQEKLEID